MISREQFQIQIDRLCDTFDDKYFSDQRTHMMWESVNDMDYNQVIAIVDSFIRSSKSAPLPVDFATAANELTKGNKTKYVLGEIQPKGVAHCWDCGDSGFVRLIRNDVYEEWAKWHRGSAPCHCQRGAELVRKAKTKAKNPTDFGSQFGDRWRQSYRIHAAIEPFDGVYTRDETVKGVGNDFGIRIEGSAKDDQ